MVLFISNFKAELNNTDLICKNSYKIKNEHIIQLIRHEALQESIVPTIPGQTPGEFFFKGVCGGNP